MLSPAILDKRKMATLFGIGTRSNVIDACHSSPRLAMSFVLIRQDASLSSLAGARIVPRLSGTGMWLAISLFATLGNAVKS